MPLIQKYKEKKKEQTQNVSEKVTSNLDILMMKVIWAQRNMHPDPCTIMRQLVNHRWRCSSTNTQLKCWELAHVLEATNYKAIIKPFLKTIFHLQPFLAPAQNPHFSEERTSVDFPSQKFCFIKYLMLPISTSHQKRRNIYNINMNELG